MRKFLSLFLSAAALGAAFWPHSVGAVYQLPTSISLEAAALRGPLSIAEMDELVNAELCINPPAPQSAGQGEEDEYIEIPDYTWQAVYPRDLTQSTAQQFTARGEVVPYFCDSAALNNYFAPLPVYPEGGPGAGAGAPPGSDIAGGPIGIVLSAGISPLLKWGASKAVGGVVESVAVEVFLQAALLYAQIGVWLTYVTGSLLAFVLGANSFITHEAVRTGWPFVQGLANLGFILALLFIAFATTLQLEIGSNWRRLLPRLLIAAILINFSLVIGGILIDASRIMMAVLARILDNSTLDAFAVRVIKSAPAITQVFDFQLNGWMTTLSPTLPRDFTHLMQAAQAVILIWGIMLAMAAMTIMLLLRYVMLLLLLIFSPFAFLATAVPNADGWAKKWWSQFIQWVAFGPIAVFMLILVVKVGGMDVTEASGAKIADFGESMVQVVITIVLLVFTAFSGKKFSAAGSTFVMNQMGKRGKQLGGAALRAHTAPMKAVGKGAAGLGKAGLQYGYESKPLSGVRRVVRGIGAMPDELRKQSKKRSDKIRKEDERSGRQFVQEQFMSPAERAQSRAEQGWANEVKSAPKDDAYHPSLEPERLRSKPVAEAIDAKQVGAIVERAKSVGDNDKQIEAVVNMPDIVKKMDVTVLTKLQNDLSDRLTRPGASPGERQWVGNVTQALSRTIREVESRERREAEKGGSGGDAGKKPKPTTT